MRWFRRPVSELTDVELPTLSDRVYRVAVRHSNEGHDCGVPFHWGPAYNFNFAETVAHVKGVPAAAVDLEAEARVGLERARLEYPEPEWESWVELLTDAGWGRV